MGATALTAFQNIGTAQAVAAPSETYKQLSVFGDIFERVDKLRELELTWEPRIVIKDGDKYGESYYRSTSPILFVSKYVENNDRYFDDHNKNSDKWK